jgi:hypothetical protein
VVTAGFAAMDVRRPPEERGSLGRFLSQLGEGNGGLTVHRTGAANVVAFATSPLTVLAVAAAVFVWFALLRDWGGLKRLYGLHPAVRAAAVGTAVATVIAGVLGGSALDVAGAAAATAVPVAALAALRVLGHAADRTPAPVVPADVATEVPAEVEAAPVVEPEPTGRTQPGSSVATTEPSEPAAPHVVRAQPRPIGTAPPADPTS